MVSRSSGYRIASVEFLHPPVETCIRLTAMLQNAGQHGVDTLQVCTHTHRYTHTQIYCDMEYSAVAANTNTVGHMTSHGESQGSPLERGARGNHAFRCRGVSRVHYSLA